MEKWLLLLQQAQPVSYTHLDVYKRQDMSGEKKGTLIGLFPKLNVEVGSFQADEMALFLSQANKAKLKIEWHDAENQVMRSGEYSLDDVTIDLKNVERMVYNPFSFQLTPIKKR